MKWTLLTDEAPPEKAEVLAYDPVADAFGFCWWDRDYKNQPRLLSAMYESDYGRADDEFDARRATHWAFLVRPDGSKARPKDTVDAVLASPSLPTP